MSQAAEGGAAFLSEVGRFVQPGSRLLDLGAGQGAQAHLFATLGARVTAIDPLARAADRVEWVAMSVEQWCSTEPRRSYDIIFTRNLLQALERKWVLDLLLPTVAARVNERGIVAIETFFAPPEPPWEGAPPSTFTVKELATRFAWPVVHSLESVEQGHDMSGVARRFHVARVILEKPKARG